MASKRLNVTKEYKKLYHLPLFALGLLCFIFVVVVGVGFELDVLSTVDDVLVRLEDKDVVLDEVPAVVLFSLACEMGRKLRM